MKSTRLMEQEEVALLRQEFLSQDELFLLKFMNEFDRRKNIAWQEAGIWNSMSKFNYN